MILTDHAQWLLALDQKWGEMSVGHADARPWLSGYCEAMSAEEVEALDANELSVKFNQAQMEGDW